MEGIDDQRGRDRNALDKTLRYNEIAEAVLGGGYSVKRGRALDVFRAVRKSRLKKDERPYLKVYATMSFLELFGDELLDDAKRLARAYKDYGDRDFSIAWRLFEPN